MKKICYLHPLSVFKIKKKNKKQGSFFDDHNNYILG